MNTVYYYTIHSSVLISIVSRILGWAAAAWTWAEIYELITGPLFSSSCSAP